MAESGEQPRQLFEQEDLVQLSRDGALVIRASSLVEQAPSRVKETTTSWNNTRLDLKAAVLANENFTVVQKVACLVALDGVEFGMKASRIQRLADELAIRYETADTALSEPGVLVMAYRHDQQYNKQKNILFKTSGTGLKLVVHDRGEGYPYGLYTGAIDEKGEEQLVLLNAEDAQNIVTDPESASKLHGLTYNTGLWTPRLIIGADTVSALLATDKHGAFPTWKWEQARGLGFRLEKIDPRLKEQYDAQRQLSIQRIARDIYTVSNPSSYQIEGLRERFDNAKFFGVTRLGVEMELSKLLDERREVVLGLFEHIVPSETEKSPAI